MTTIGSTSFGTGAFSTGAGFVPRAAVATRSTPPRLRLTRRGRAVVTLLVAVPLAVGGVAFGLSQNAAATAPTESSASTSTPFHYVTVGTGETLWSVAERVAPNSDPRDVIADIMQLNQLTSASVQPGQRIAIPLKYEH